MLLTSHINISGVFDPGQVNGDTGNWLEFVYQFAARFNVGEKLYIFTANYRQGESVGGTLMERFPVDVTVNDGTDGTAVVEGGVNLPQMLLDYTDVEITESPFLRNISHPWALTASTPVTDVNATDFVVDSSLDFQALFDEIYDFTEVNNLNQIIIERGIYTFYIKSCHRF